MAVNVRKGSPPYDTDTIYAWFGGEQPRPMYELTRAEGHWLTVGQAAPEGIPILLRKHEYVVWKVLPFLDKTAPPRGVEWTGWTRNDEAQYPSRLPTCTQPPGPGSVTFLLGDSLEAEVDGVKETPDNGFVAAYKVRITGSAACVVGILAPVVPVDVPVDAWEHPEKLPGVNFIRAHFLTGRAEAGAREPKQPLQRLNCMRP